jgi:hypothetical protein
MKNVICIVFGLLCLMLSGCYSAYKIRSGECVYVEWNAGVGYRVSRLEGADVASFKVLADPEFASDANSVFWRNWRIKGADPSTFRPLAKGYWRDRNKVFYGQFEIVGADPESFQIHSIEPWSTDKNDAYRGFSPVHVDDILSFVVIDRHWAKDAKSLLFWLAW